MLLIPLIASSVNTIKRNRSGAMIRRNKIPRYTPRIMTGTAIADTLRTCRVTLPDAMNRTVLMTPVAANTPESLDNT